jgi:Tfp pilus assembly major pilin PilA
MTDKARLGLQAMSLIDELGFGIRVDGDTVRMLASVRTAMSNPDDVIAKLLKIPPDDIITGQAAATAKQIATASPSSPFAADYKAGVGGIMVPTAVIGVIAAVAIPAYMDYMKKSKRPEAKLQLERLDKALKATHATNGAFPKGKVGPTPAKSCCVGPNHTCDEPVAWQNPIWKKVGFEMADAHLFRYSYESDGKTFTAKAIGDLDCDGNEIAWVLHGATDANGNVLTTVIEPAPGTD